MRRRPFRWHTDEEMNGAHGFLTALATVLCVAAVVTVVFQRLRQPVVLGYILAGLIVGPHFPVPLVADRQIVQTLSELGVILLMFSIGIELSLSKLLQVGKTSAFVAVLQCSVMIWLGFTAGRALGWSSQESVFAGAMVAISSTTVVVKAFDERGIQGRLRDLVLGVLVVQDMIAVLLMATLTAVASGRGLSAVDLVAATGHLALFLVGLVVVGLFLVPRAIHYIRRLDRPETTLVANIGFCFAMALLALHFGYSVALGAFIAGALVSESGEGRPIARLIEPVRDMFTAVFFVSVGMMIEPALVVRHWPAIAVFTVLVVAGQVLSVSFGAFLAGNSIRTSVQSGMSLAQIGEFSFIIIGLGVSLGAAREFLYPVAVAVAVVTTLCTPWLIRASGAVANLVDRKLPRPIQTFVALYGSWIERLRAAPRRDTMGRTPRRLVRLLLLDAVLLGGLVIGASVYSDEIVSFLGDRLGLREAVARVLSVLAAVVLAIPFCVGIFRVVNRLGATLAGAAFPAARRGKVDMSAAPRRALIVTLRLAAFLLVAMPLLALTQPFIAGPQGAIVLVLLLGLLGFAFWRSAANLHGHVKAGAEMIMEALAAQVGAGAIAAEDQVLEKYRHLLPGLGELLAVRLGPGSAAVGQTLAQLNLRGVTGATVLAINRGEAGGMAPCADEVLRLGDVLALTGTRDSIEGARIILHQGERRKRPRTKAAVGG